jgi:hypothetical protein
MSGLLFNKEILACQDFEGNNNPEKIHPKTRPVVNF